mmetsp:Transcript_11321/g.36163  ORF Transcript_11321/g.36163 Transcript_11321/m.36163 type:complete len:220 (+) Transcript_11321:209-868(+)
MPRSPRLPVETSTLLRSPRVASCSPGARAQTTGWATRTLKASSCHTVWRGLLRRLWSMFRVAGRTLLPWTVRAESTPGAGAVACLLALAALVMATRSTSQSPASWRTWSRRSDASCRLLQVGSTRLPWTTRASSGRGARASMVGLVWATRRTPFLPNSSSSWPSWSRWCRSQLVATIAWHLRSAATCTRGDGTMPRSSASEPTWWTCFRWKRSLASWRR